MFNGFSCISECFKGIVLSNANVLLDFYDYCPVCDLLRTQTKEMKIKSDLDPFLMVSMARMNRTVFAHILISTNVSVRVLFASSFSAVYEI